MKGEGEQQDYGMRVYDTRLGKFLSVDPLTKDYPWYTPYQFTGNKPIWAIDLDGMEEYFKSGVPYGYIHNGAPIGTSYPAGGFGWTVLDERDGGIDGGYSVTKLRILDAKNNHYFVKKMERCVTSQTSWGAVSNKEVKWSYNTEAPRLKSDPKSYDGPPIYKPFETEEQIAARQNSQVSDGIGTFFFGSAVVLSATPAMTATGGGPLWGVNNPFTKVGLMKAVIGGGADILAQKTVAFENPINWFSVGVNAIISNTWSAAMISGAEAKDENGNWGLNNFESWTIGTLANGIVGSVSGKIMGKYAPKKFTSCSDNIVRTLAGTLVGYYGNTISSVAGNAIPLITGQQKSSNTTNAGN